MRDAMKQAAGYYAAEFVQDGMRVGLGTGSTAFHLIERLIQRCREGLRIQAVATSRSSLEQARRGHIPLLDIETLTELDLTLDGADEIDPSKRMIKGGGGALVREKIVASMSREMVIIIDASKQVAKLGTCPLPVEIIPFAVQSTLHNIQESGYVGHLRKTPEGQLYRTDNGNYIVDLQFDRPRDTPERDHEILLHIPGVVDTGFFFNLAGRVVIGTSQGEVIVE